MVEWGTNKGSRGNVSLQESPTLPFSPAAGQRDLIFVSGIVGRDPRTDEMSEDIGEQTRQILESIQQQLRAVAGSSLDRVLKVTVFLVDIGLYQEVNRIYGDFFGHDSPACSCFQVSGLPDKEALVEIEVIAAR